MANYTLSPRDEGRLISLADGTEIDEANREIKGRLLLWHQAVGTTIAYLHTGYRAKKAKEQENIRAELDQYHEDFEEYRKRQPDYEDKVIKGEHMRSFDKEYRRPFPTFVECHHIYESCISMAVVAFCQIFNRGDPDSGKVASNDKSFRAKHWSRIVDTVFPDAKDKKCFQAFCNEIQLIRNSMLGHADGRAYELEHGDAMTRVKTMTYDIYDLDLKYWMSFLEPLRLAISTYLDLSEQEHIAI